LNRSKGKEWFFLASQCQQRTDFCPTHVSLYTTTNIRTGTIEPIMPEVREMPFYQLVNTPLSVLITSQKINQKVIMADLHPNQALQTQIQT
jgi:hypothetical protein